MLEMVSTLKLRPVRSFRNVSSEVPVAVLSSGSMITTWYGRRDEPSGTDVPTVGRGVDFGVGVNVGGKVAGIGVPLPHAASIETRINVLKRASQGFFMEVSVVFKEETPYTGV